MLEDMTEYAARIRFEGVLVEDVKASLAVRKERYNPEE
jgi:hypothetical protein